MKKPCKDATTGSKIESKKFKVINPFFSWKWIYLLVLFSSSQIFPQIPINGFCKYNFFEIDSGYTNLYSLNFNNDSYTDLILFKAGDKNITAINGDQNGSFDIQNKFELPHSIAKIKTLYDKNNMVIGHAFTSRRDLIAGIYTFNEEGKPTLLKSKKFNSYPENISTGKIDSEGDEKILLSGSSFEGLSILSQTDTVTPETENELIETKIAEKSVYSEAVFVDLNNDLVNDIAAFDLLNYSLTFFYNNSIGEFTKIRSIEFPDQIFSLQAFDLNLDFYQDLIFVKNGAITIMYGDFSSSYSNVVSLNTNFYPDRIITGDFNRDGRTDIAYINFNESVFSIFFAKNENEFFEEIIYFKKEGIINLIPYYSKFISGITVLSSFGKIYSITRLNTFSAEINLSIGVNPSGISYFDNENNGINDICFIDSYDNKLKLLIRNSAGIPSLFYSFSLFGNNDHILVDDRIPKEKTFFCYKKGENFIEVIRINFVSSKLKRSTLYIPGKISSLKYLNKTGEFFRIFSAHINKNKLGVTLFNINDNSYQNENYANIALNVKNLNITGLSDLSLYFWQKENNSITLKRSNYKDKFINAEKLFSLPFKEKINIISFSGDLLNIEEEITISFLTGLERKIILSSDKWSGTFAGIKLLEKLDVINENQLFFGELKINGIKKLTVYNPVKKILYRIDILRNGKEIVASKLVENINIKKYFIKNMNFKKYHLIYINSLQNCISITPL